MKTFLSLVLSAFFLSLPALASPVAMFSPWSGEGGFWALTQEPVPPGMSLVRLATLTSDKDNNRVYLNLMVDGEHTATGMYNKADPHNTGPGEGQGKTVIWMKDIESSQGAVMYTSRGYNVLVLQGRLDSSQQGDFKLYYLTNGLFHSYSSCDFLLRKSGSDSWFIQNAYTGETVRSVKVITKSLGVQTVQGICPD